MAVKSFIVKAPDIGILSINFVDEMTNWWSGQLKKQPDDGARNWSNDQWTKQQLMRQTIDESTSRWNIQSMKQHVDE